MGGDSLKLLRGQYFLVGA